MSIALKDLRYYLMSGQNVPTGYEDIYNKSYDMWKNVWSQALTDLQSPQQIFCDGFTRQTKLGVLFYQDKCVAMSAFREVDLSLKVNRDDSLLRSWTDEAFAKLTRNGTKISIASYLTVAPEFRGPIAENMTLKLLTCFLTTECLIGSDCDAMTGTMRCNKGTDKSAYSAGAEFIAKSQMYGVDVDLVGFFKKDILKEKSKFSNLWSETLWNNRTDLMPENQEFKHFKKIS